MENPDGRITVMQGGSYTFVAQQPHTNPQLMDLKTNVKCHNHSILQKFDVIQI